MPLSPLRLAAESGFGSLEQEVRQRTDLVRHELRAPLSTMVGVVRRRLNNEDGVKELAKDLKLIERTALHLLSVIDDTFFAPRAVRHHAHAHNRSVTPVSSIRRDVVSLDDLMEDFRECGTWLCEAHGNVLKTSLQGSLPNLISVDAKAVRQIVYNLLTNAARCCREGVISVRLSCTRQQARAYLMVSVVDTGIGLSLEQQERILAGVAVSDTPQRKGLGLRVIRDRLAELGGSLDVQSQPGNGTAFFVKIPIRVVENAGWALIDQAEVSSRPARSSCEAGPMADWGLPARELEQLAELASGGEISGVYQWIENMAGQARGDQAGSRFVEIIRRAAERLDMDMIAQIARAVPAQGGERT